MPQIKATDLQVNQPIEAAAPDSSLVIDVDPAKPLKPGTYLFQLEVVDDAGNRSQPTRAKLVVIDDTAPNAIISAPSTVSVGRTFTLSGKDSTDIGGTIEKFIWTLVQ
jgi:hypothetical protein